MKRKIYLLIVLSVTILLIHLFFNVPGNIMFSLKLRGNSLIAMITTSVAISYSTIIFQTIVNNKILTPGIIGFENIYVIIQTILVFLFGVILNELFSFVISLVIMMLMATFFFIYLFKKVRYNTYILLLVGIVLSSLLANLSDFLQYIMDPNEFLILQGSLFASFNNVDFVLNIICFVLVIVGALFVQKYCYILDVITLGKDYAINLGINFNKALICFMMIVSFFVSISTALVGPIMFLGLIVCNITYELMKTYQHNILLVSCSLVSFIFLTGAQFIATNVFNNTITVSVIINLIGGLYFFYLIVTKRESK